MNFLFYYGKDDAHQHLKELFPSMNPTSFNLKEGGNQIIMALLITTPFLSGSKCEYFEFFIFEDMLQVFHSRPNSA